MIQTMLSSLRRVILLCVLLLAGQLCAQTAEDEYVRTPLAIGESVTFFSDLLQEERKLNIYLPQSYHEASTRYPVIFLLDGGMDEDMIHISGLVQFLSFPWIEAVPESIVVGISNVDRRKDFTFPTSVEKDKTDYPTTGHSARFIKCLEEELLPFVHAAYRTDTITTLIGQSLGGLLAAEILITKPAMFDNYVIVSPSLWWDNGSLLQEAFRKDHAAKTVYLAVGDEGEEMQALSSAFYQKLSEVYAQPNRLKYQRFDHLDHGNILHLAAYDALEWVFETSK